MIYHPSTHYESTALESISESLRKRFGLNETPEKRSLATRNTQIGSDRYNRTMKGTTNGGEEFRTVDSIITEESSKNMLPPKSPEVDATKKLSFINNPESATKTLKASIISK